MGKEETVSFAMYELNAAKTLLLVDGDAFYSVFS